VKIEETITVDRPVEAVWALFQDVEQLARCLPGADLTEDKGGGVYGGRVAAKLGPMTATFEGECTVTTDAASLSGEVKGKGTDRAGGSVGQVDMKYTITPAEGGGSTVAVDADVVLSGAAAQFGRTGLIREMSRRLIDEFVRCVEAKLAAETAAEAAAVQAAEVKGLRLFLASLWSWLKGLFKRG